MPIYVDYGKTEVAVVLSSEGKKLAKNTPKNDIFDKNKQFLK